MAEPSLSRSFRPAKNLSIYLLIPLLSCSWLVSAILSPPLPNGTANTLSRLLLPANASGPSAPAPPLGFRVDIHYDPRAPLSPLGIYLSAIDFTYKFAQSGWYQGFSGGFTVWRAGFDAEVDVESSQEPGAPLRLQTNHIVLGLYETITDVAARSRFCAALVTLSLHGRQIGVLKIEARRPAGASETSGAGSVPGDNDDAPPPASNAVTYPTGEIIDRDDPDFSISYTYTGASINSKEIILAVLDALTTAAQSAPGAFFRSLDAASASGICAIGVRGVENPLGINYSYVTKALRTIVSDIMVPLRRFGEMTLRILWQGVKIGEGEVRLAGQALSA